MKSPTLRNTAQKLGQTIHQSAYAEERQAEVVRQLLAQGYELGVHDEIVFTMGQMYDHMPQDDGTMLAVPIGKPEPFDFRCGRCGAGWNFKETHKCK